MIFNFKVGVMGIVAGVGLWVITVMELRLIHIRLETQRFRLLTLLKETDMHLAKVKIEKILGDGRMDVYKSTYTSLEEMMTAVKEFIGKPDIVTALDLAERYPAFLPAFGPSGSSLAAGKVAR